MCGLAGWIFEPKAARKRRHQTRPLMAALLVANDARGGHSWGYYLPETGEIRKGLGRADAMGPKDVEPLAAAAAAMVHTRFATTGDRTVENAHPFDLGSIVGAHNGTVGNHRELNHKYNRDCKVDSEHLFLHLAEGRDPDDIEAYGAITYCEVPRPPDAGPEILVARFNGGSLTLAEAKGLGWCYSSDDDHLRAALTLAGIEFELWTPHEGKMLAVSAKGFEHVRAWAPKTPWAKRTEYRGATNYSYRSSNGGYCGFYSYEKGDDRADDTGGTNWVPQGPSVPARDRAPSHSAYDDERAAGRPADEDDTDLEGPDEYELDELELEALEQVIEIAKDEKSYELGRMLTDAEEADIEAEFELYAEQEKAKRVDEAKERAAAELAWKDRARKAREEKARREREDEEWDRFLAGRMEEEVGNK